MVLSASHKWPFVINLGNSIIGVAVLAMPFCFKQCGILLGVLVLLFCTWLTLASCQLLVKAGIMSHYQSYEYLAYHTYGAPGKFLVEIGMIGMQLGTLVAQIVVIGDLGPPIISHLLGFENNWRNRMYLIIILCLFVGLPLGLMKDLRNVSRASTVCIAFYAVFVLYCLWQSSESLWKGEWLSHVNLWRPQGFFQCLPIMSFSFGCQTQLFILYDALPEPSLPAIKGIIHSAVNLCCITYLLVGFLGYVTFYHLDIPGDIITVFPATLSTHLIKLGFVMSIAITFPVIIYPCRASIYTLLFQKKSKHSDIVTSSYIPEHLFKGITITIVMGSMITGILIPNVEFVLGLNGAITGTLICYIFPALFFLQVSKPEGKTVAQIVLALGVAILLVSTFTTLYAQDKSHTAEDVQKAVQEAADRVKVGDLPQDHIENREAVPHLPRENANQEKNKGRLEPPYPFAPVEKVKDDDVAKQREKQAEGNQDVKKAAAHIADKKVKEEKAKNVVPDVKKDTFDAQQHQRELPQKEQKVVVPELQQQQPQQQDAAALQQPGRMKQDQNVVNQQPVVAQDQNVMNQPPVLPAQGQGAANQDMAQGQAGANNPPAGLQGQSGVNQPQVLAQNQNEGNPAQGLAQQGQDRVNQPQAMVQGQGVQQPQVLAQQGADPALQFQGVGQQQGQGRPADQLAPVVQQQHGQGRPVDQQAPAVQQQDLPQQEQGLQQGQAIPGKQHPDAMLQPDKAALGQQQAVFQDREILADQGGQSQQR
ncbi:putative sodium-coupled neutral amino acid transporter 10 isoform X2 [Babylonia areolata]|uniref:putative sodium-coupled neutral amino acid transporter 10 isoform X2 n=1 Tax=Babylonia areolata TaxID=304850 RepID=UPI003FD23D1B